MSFQTSVTSLPTAQVGDAITPSLNGGRILTYRVADNLQVLIGQAAWILATDVNKITNVKGANTVLAGIVVRNNTNVWPTAPTAQGSIIIPAGQNASTLVRGQIAVTLTAIIAGTPAFNDPIWVRNTDGAIVTGVTVETGYTKTNFVFAQQSAVANDIIFIVNNNDVAGA